MKKIFTVISALAVLAAAGAGTILHSKADMKIETESFSVSSDRSRTPSAYCRNSDGSPVSKDYSSSDNFCISQYANGNMSRLSSGDYPAYCIGSHLQNAPVTITEVQKCSDISYDSEQYGPIFRIAAAGASSGRSDYGLNDDDLYYVTQCAVRSYIYNISPDSLAFYNSDGTRNDAMTAEFMRIAGAAYEPPLPDTYSICINDENAFQSQFIAENKAYCRYGPYYAWSPDTSLTGYNIVLQEENTGAYIMSSDNPESLVSENTFSPDSPFYVYIENAFENEITLNISSEISRRKAEPVVYLTSDDNFQDIFQVRLSDVNETLTAQLKLQNSGTSGDIRLNKKFLADGLDISDTELIAQPRFTLKNENGKYISGMLVNGMLIFNCFSDEPVEYALNPDSTLSISGLPTGNYYVCEVKGAEGYTAEEPEVFINNTPELNICEIVNVSETTTVTTAETTTETTLPEITFTITETSYMTAITEVVVSESETETEVTETITETTQETSEETTISTEATSYTESSSSSEITYESTSEIIVITEKTTLPPSNPRLPRSPETGENSRNIIFIIISAVLSASVIIISGKKSTSL